MTTVEAGAKVRLSQRAERTTEPPISWLMRLTIEDPEIISLAAGFVDQQSLPADAMREMFDRMFVSDIEAKKTLQYGSTAGLQELRRKVATRLESQGVPGPVDPDHVVITNGSQQFLYLATDVLVDPGDIVLVEDPTYFVYTGVLEGAGARTLGVATDDDGMVPEALEQRLNEVAEAGELERVKLLYVQTYYQNPKGTSTSAERLERIFAIAEKFSTAEHPILILEDAAYRDLRYDGPEIPFMKTLDPGNERIMLAMTFSKGFAPGLRLGYAYLPPHLVGPVLHQKGNHDFGSSNLAQHFVNHALETGWFDRHGARLRERYAAKRDLMLKVIREEFPAGIAHVEPQGGLYVWTTLPEGVSTSPGSKFFDEAMKRKVLYVPGCYCYAQEAGRTKPDNQIRLCFGFIDEDPMVEGMRRLAEAIRAAV